MSLPDQTHQLITQRNTVITQTEIEAHMRSALDHYQSCNTDE